MLMTVSTASIPVLHSAEVAHLYPQVMLPICQGIATSHTPLPRNPLQFIGSSNAGIPRMIAIAAKSSQGPPYTDHSPTALAPN
jgi:hypothetical protein